MLIFIAFLKNQLFIKSSLVSDIAQRGLEISFRRFGTACRSSLQESSGSRTAYSLRLRHHRSIDAMNTLLSTSDGRIRPLFRSLPTY
jgi:hypothetical protein